MAPGRHFLALAVRSLARQCPSCRSRRLHTSNPRQVQRLLWAGAVLDETSPKLRPASSAWLASLGMGRDAEYGITFTHLATSPSHSLLAYRTLPPSDYELPAPEAASDHGEEPTPNDPSRPKRLPGANQTRQEPESPTKYAGLEKIISIGRNTFAELGLGFSSHESTWGMVKSGHNFAGSNSIKQLAAGLNTSWAITSSSSGSSDRLFAWGNHSLGQLGLGAGAGQDQSTSGESQLRLFSSPRQLELPELPDGEGGSQAMIDKVAVGLDHALILRSWSSPSRSDGKQRQLLGCGLNTDAQLGLPLRVTHSWDLQSVIDECRPTDVAAGGDTSSAFSPGSSAALAWGNSEYGQALWGSRPLDRIEAPASLQAEMDGALGDEAIRSIVHGDSFTLVLTDGGRLLAAGFGSIGVAHGTEAPSSVVLQEIAALRGHRVRKVSSGLEYACAVTEDERIFVWGLNSTFGRLGLGSRDEGSKRDLRVFEPTEIQLPPSLEGMPYQVESLACGGDTMWVLLEQDDGTGRRGRWLGR
ncbi:hypothetical protein V8E36_003994 [Tilletia maclaganii]